MGKYITTNLNVYLQYDKKEAKSQILKEKSDLAMITEPFFANPLLFDFEEEKKWYIWSLKPEILKNNLYSLLERFYTDIYGNNSHFSDDCKNILEGIARADDLIAYGTNSQFGEPFSFKSSWDCYFAGGSMQQYALGHFMFSLEGKVVTEGMQRHLEFFTRLLRDKYADNPLSSCFKVSVWG